jgi:sialic acid synthase SpsE/sugar phosphate isomerase/epimerase
MIVVRDFSEYVVIGDEPMTVALAKIEKNLRGCVIVVDQHGRLIGTMTDGDFRRWLVSRSEPTLEADCSEAANSNCVSAPERDGAMQLSNLLSRNIDMLPLLDETRRVIAVAFRRTRDLFLEGRRISEQDPAFLIAEIGINHNGDLNTGKILVEKAAEAGADCAKFQMRVLSSLYRDLGSSTESEDLGAEYTLDLLAESHLDNHHILDLMSYTRELGMVPLCTPWDEESAVILSEYGVPGFKVASADLTNHPLLRQLAGFGLPLIVSTGMSTESEIVDSVGLLRGCAASFALLQCNSAYPAANKDLNLRYMDRLAELGNCVVGYSGHERGFHIALAAVARGAHIVEKHITLDRKMRGNDHVVSLEPAEFALMVKSIRDIEDSLGTDSPRVLTQGEQLNRLSLAKSLVASKPLILGEVVTENDVLVRSPGRGIQPNRLHELLGKKINRDIPQGDFFYEADISEAGAAPRNYKVNRPWGVPVRFHDWKEIAGASNPDFLEFHLSYRDMDSDLEKVMPESLPYSLIVHSPDLFSQDHILDLAAEDPKSWQRSIDELQRVIDLTRTLKPKFQGSLSAKVVVSMGGSSMHSPLPISERPKLYERVANGVSALDTEGVEVLAQTLPPYPWYLGGQRFCNLFVDPEETANFSLETGVRLCLDVAHTKLACTHLRQSFSRAIDLLAPVADHLHLVDASGMDGEGLQILEGDIDWMALTGQLDVLAPRVSFIPEIWQGHVGQGQGFWIAMERLEPLFDSV